MGVKKWSAALILVVLSGAINACTANEGQSDSRDDEALLVATTVSPITSIVSRVGGDRVDVRGIVPEGTNSHTYEPPPSVAATLAEADVEIGRAHV